MTTIPSHPKVLLIGWDGADWEHMRPLLGNGLMPNLEHLISGGVMGNIATLYPILSPMLWNSVATGKLADQHGILGFTEPDPINGGARPFASTSRKSKALWNILSQNGLSSNVVNWWASHPAEPIRGAMVSNSFVHSAWSADGGWRHLPGTFYPEELSDSLSDLRVHTLEITQREILPFIPNAGKVNQAEDHNLETFAKQLAQCISIQAVSTWLMENHSCDFTAIYFEAVDHFCHAFMHFAPPKMPHISEEEFDIYKDVIDGVYRFHDMMLGRLLSLVDDNTYVILCSDHGFLSGMHRPRFTPNEPAGPAYWHRPLGIFAMQGPGIRQDELVFGASLLDVAPTILTIFGLPIGEDMKGRPLVDAFERAPEVKSITSWEHVEDHCGRLPPGTAMDRSASRELMDQFVALGYIEDPGDDLEKACRKTEIENQYNLARVYLSTSREAAALPIMQKLLEESPWENRFILHAARCYFECGYLQQTMKLLNTAYPEVDQSPAVVLAMIGRVQVRLGHVDVGLQLLKQAEDKQSTLSGLHVEIARTYLSQREWKRAKTAAELELEVNPTSAEAHALLAAALLRLNENEAALDSALTAVTIKHRLPHAHFVLGVAAARQGWDDRAERALQAALSMQPNLPAAHRILSAIHRKDSNRFDTALMHTELARQRWTMRREAGNLQNLIVEQLFDVPSIPTPKERIQRMHEERPRKIKKGNDATASKSGKTFTLVSGLPRSGTSLMMQMLAAGGMEPKTDGERIADDDNPQGYYEWEAVKQVGKQPELLDEEGLDSKAIKVISMLLQSMPARHDYNVIFMTRPVEEIVASQAKMIDRLGTEGAELDRGQLEQQLAQHRSQTLRWLNNAKHMEVIEVDFPSLVASPSEPLRQVVEFVGEGRLGHLETMANVVRPELHRQKTGISS